MRIMMKERPMNIYSNRMRPLNTSGCLRSEICAALARCRRRCSVIDHDMRFRHWGSNSQEFGCKRSEGSDCRHLGAEGSRSGCRPARRSPLLPMRCHVSSCPATSVRHERCCSSSDLYLTSFGAVSDKVCDSTCCAGSRDILKMQSPLLRSALVRCIFSSTMQASWGPLRS